MIMNIGWTVANLSLINTITKDWGTSCFSDECSIYLSQKPYNTTMWCKDNPYFWEQVQQYRRKVMVWATMSAKHLIGPFLIEGKEDAQCCQEMLKNEFIPELQRRGLLFSCHFQQDGSPPHNAYDTREFLNHHSNSVAAKKSGFHVTMHCGE